MEIKHLSLAVGKYRDGQMSLDQFADWFRAVSRRKFAESEEVRSAILEVDSAFSRLDFDGIDEAEFRRELESAVHPSVPQFSMSWRRVDPSSEVFVQAEPADEIEVGTSVPIKNVARETWIFDVSSEVHRFAGKVGVAA